MTASEMIARHLICAINGVFVSFVIMLVDLNCDTGPGIICLQCAYEVICALHSPPSVCGDAGKLAK